MTEPLTVTTERVDDIPILLAQSDTMGIPELLDECFKPHGNWEGISLGWTTAVWLAHILSEGDHRMNQVQGWVAQRLQTLHLCTGPQVQECSWSDDRLTQVVAGKAADDPLYIPAIKQVSQSLPEHGVLYVGDCKMAALATRAYLQAQGDYYLCPLAQTQLPPQELDTYLQPVWSGEQPVVAVHRAKTEEQ